MTVLISNSLINNQIAHESFCYQGLGCCECFQFKNELNVIMLFYESYGAQVFMIFIGALCF